MNKKIYASLDLSEQNIFLLQLKISDKVIRFHGYQNSSCTCKEQLIGKVVLKKKETIIDMKISTLFHYVGAHTIVDNVLKTSFGVTWTWFTDCHRLIVIVCGSQKPINTYLKKKKIVKISLKSIYEYPNGGLKSYNTA